MELRLFDRDPSSILLWTRIAEAHQLRLIVYPYFGPSESPRNEPSSFMVIDQQAVHGDFVKRILEVMQAAPLHGLIVTGANFSVNDVATLMHHGVAYVLPRPLDVRDSSKVVDFVAARTQRLSASREEFSELADQLSALTDRELDVLNHVLEGTSNREAAGVLGVSVRTVESRRAKLYRKLKAVSVAEVVRKVDRLAALTCEFKLEGSRVEAIPALAPHFRLAAAVAGQSPVEADTFGGGLAEGSVAS